MKKEKQDKVRSYILSIFLLSSLIVAGILLSLMTPSTYIVFGANFSNVTSQVNISNTEPWVTDVSVDDSISSPADEIDLSPGSTINVWCNATVHDWNGASDIVGANASFYHNLRNPLSPIVNSSAYMDSICYNTSQTSDTINYMCNLTVMYYAWNGTWTCNVTGRDISGTFSSNFSTTYVNELYAITVPDIIDYGQMDVNSISVNETLKNVTNEGNVWLDLDLFGFARAIDDGFAMNCSQAGTIPIGNQYFDINQSNNTVAFKTALSGVQATPNQVDFNMTFRNDSNGFDYIKLTDWKLSVPYGVAGWCNGTVVFGGVPNTYS